MTSDAERKAIEALKAEGLNTGRTVSPDGSLPVTEVFALVTLEELKQVLNHWLYFKDPDIINIILAVAIAEKIPGDPVWLFIIAPPGGCKTEILRALDGVDYYHLSDLTSKTFVSGLMLGNGEERRKIDDLLPQLNGKVLIFKDFTTVLEKNKDERQEIIAQLREMYDGRYAKKFGSIDKKIEYHSRFGLLAGVTPVIDRHWKLMQQLGERFLKCRWDEDDDLTTRRAEENEGKEAIMREEIHAAMMGYLTHLTITEPTMDKVFVEPIIAAAKFLALMRTPVSIRSGQGDFYYDYIPVPERPTRLVKQLKKLCKCLAAVRGADRVSAEDVRVAEKVALSTAPQDRVAVLQAVKALQNTTLNGCTVVQVKGIVHLPETSIRNICEQLRMLDLLIAEDIVETHGSYSQTVKHFKLTAKASALTPPTSVEGSKKIGGDAAGKKDRAEQEPTQDTWLGAAVSAYFDKVFAFLSGAPGRVAPVEACLAVFPEKYHLMIETEYYPLWEKNGVLYEPKPGYWGLL